MLEIEVNNLEIRFGAALRQGGADEKFGKRHAREPQTEANKQTTYTQCGKRRRPADKEPARRRRFLRRSGRLSLTCNGLVRPMWHKSFAWRLSLVRGAMSLVTRTWH